MIVIKSDLPVFYRMVIVHQSLDNRMYCELISEASDGNSRETTVKYIVIIKGIKFH